MTKRLDKKKEQFKDSYINFSNEQIRNLEATKSEEEFDAMMFDYVEQENIGWYIQEGMTEGEAVAKARMLRKKAGG